MTKPLITFLLAFAFVFGVVATVKIRENATNAAIAKAPVYVLATPDGITKKTRKGRTSFQVNYTYVAAGATHTIDTDFFSTEAEAMAMTESPVQVAYAAGNPAQAAFKSEFDKRDPNAGMAGVLGMAAAFGLGLGLLLTLGLLWKYPWLRGTA